MAHMNWICGGLLVVLLGAEVATGADEARERFVDRKSYVEDMATGLLWQKDGDDSGKFNFYGAAQYAKQLKLGDMKGWRVPTAKELKTIFPATTAPFKDTHYREGMCCGGGGEWPAYWTSDLDKRIDDYAYVYQWYGDGGANNCFASKNLAYVRCVHDSLTDPAGTEARVEAVLKKATQPVDDVVAALDTMGARVSQNRRSVQATFVKAKPHPDDMRKLVRLPFIESLTLISVPVGDADLAELRNLSTLKSLHITACDATDEGLRSLSELSNLERLELYGTQDPRQISDEGLASLTKLTKLHTLRIYGSQITDAGLAHLQGLSQLRSLGLGQSSVTGTGFANSGLQNLEDLGLTFAPLSDAGLEAIKSFKKLRSLHCGMSRNVTDEGIRHLADLPNLSTLEIHNTGLTDAGTSYLARMKGLRFLSISDTQVTDQGLANLESLSQLQVLWLHGLDVSDKAVQRLQSKIPAMQIHPRKK